MIVNTRRAGCGQTFNQFFCEYSLSQWRKDVQPVSPRAELLEQCFGTLARRWARRYQRWQDLRSGGRADLADQSAPWRAAAATARPDSGAARGHIPNETDYAAKSTLTAIMGRMAAYSGQPVSWDDAFAQASRWPTSTNSLHSTTQLPCLPNAHGRYPVPVPGQSGSAV